MQHSEICLGGCWVGEERYGKYIYISFKTRVDNIKFCYRVAVTEDLQAGAAAGVLQLDVVDKLCGVL